MRSLGAIILLILWTSAGYSGSVHTTYLWHMHQPIYWPDASQWEAGTYQKAYESIYWKQNGGNVYPGSSGSHPFNDLDQIFSKDDRIADYQYYPRNALSAVWDVPDCGAQVSFAASLIENISSLSEAGWHGGAYGGDWRSDYREAALWTTSNGKPRLDLVGVGAHHAVNPLIDPLALRKEIQVQKAARQWLWPDIPETHGFFPAETCFSERMIPVLVQEGYEWVFVPNIHISRACTDYPFEAMGDNIDPPNPADQINGAGGEYFELTIPRGVTTRNAVPLAYRPHTIQYVDPYSGFISRMIAVPTAQGMSWNEGYGPYGFGEIDQVAWASTPENPLLVVFAHDGDNAYSGGYSYYNENVPNFCHQAQNLGHHPTTVDQYLADNPVDPQDVVHVEDGGWVNADGDFGSPQYINWNWPLVDASGQFDIPAGWAEDQRNWAVITAAHSFVETAEQMAGPSRAHQIFRPQDGGTDLEKAWHFYLSALESGYMYYGSSLDMEVKATFACNHAVSYAQQSMNSADDPDETGPAIWLPQRLPWNPGGMGMGSLWNYEYISMDRDFYVWTFVHDPNGVTDVKLYIRVDDDGVNPLNTTVNETFAGGLGVGDWIEMPMNWRDFPAEDIFNDPEIDFFVLPDYIADEYWVLVEGYENVLLDYFVEAEDSLGNIDRSPIQHVYVGDQNNPQTGVSWEPENPTYMDVITITVHDPGQGGWLHWGVNADGNDWETPHTAYWPPGTELFQGAGPAVETELEGPDENDDYSIEIGPFNDPVQTVETVDFVIHFYDDTWDNNNDNDYHITVSPFTPTPSPTPSPSPTPTIFPTRTPYPTKTDTPTPDPSSSPTQTNTPYPTATPSPAPGEAVIFLNLNKSWFKAEDRLILTRTIANPNQTPVPCSQWIALEVLGSFYFYPSWTTTPESESFTLPPFYVDAVQVLNILLPDEISPGGPYFFHALLTDSETGAVVSKLDSEVFGFYQSFSNSHQSFPQ